MKAENQACGHCGALDGFTQRSKGPHIGVYCIACDGWQRWIPRRSVEPDAVQFHPWGSPPAKEKAPRFTPRQLAHPENVNERLAAVEHDLGIIAQIVVGVRHE